MPGLVAQALGVSSLYWIALYIFPVKGSKDSDAVIKSRVLRIALASLLTTMVTPWAATRFSGTYTENLANLGLRFDAMGSLKAIALTAVLFIGPMLCYGPDIEGSWIGLRNYVVAPFTEELVYRAAIISLYIAAGATVKRQIWETPLYFGVAHLHHGVANYRDGHPIAQCASSAFAHFCMTTGFGVYAAKLFVTWNSVWPCVLAHAFCNAMGPPPDGPTPYRVMLVLGLVLFVSGLNSI